MFSEEQIVELVNDRKLRAYKMNGDYNINIGSLRRSLDTVNPYTLEPKKDLFT